MQRATLRNLLETVGGGAGHVASGRLRDADTVWGDEWLHAGSTLMYETAGSQGRPDRDELVFFVPGNAGHAMRQLVDEHCLKTRLAPSEAMAISMRERINAAYFAPDLHYMHDQLAVAAWYGVVASGRSAWMPIAFAQYFLDPVDAGFVAARDRVFTANVDSWWLVHRIAKCAASVMATGSPRTIKGRLLKLR